MDGFDIILLCILVAMIFTTIGYLLGRRVWYKEYVDGLIYVGPSILKPILSIPYAEAYRKNYIVLKTATTKEENNGSGED